MVTHPPILTFKPRRGRVTPGQQRALDALWPAYGVEIRPERLDVPAVFGRIAPLILEIGFGMGEATAELAAADPTRDVLAVDVHTPGAGALLARVERLGLSNVRVGLGDARDALRDMLGPGSLAEVRAFFPDPWPKARHRKRRLVEPHFARLVADRLRAGGRLHCVTDSATYAEQMLAVIDAEPALHSVFGGVAPRPAWRPMTRFETQARARGHDVVDVIAARR